MVSDNCLSLPLEDGIYADAMGIPDGRRNDDDASPDEGIKTFFPGPKPSREFALHGVDDNMGHHE